MLLSYPLFPCLTEVVEINFDQAVSNRTIVCLIAVCSRMDVDDIQTTNVCVDLLLFTDKDRGTKRYSVGGESSRVPSQRMRNPTRGLE